MVSLSLEWSTNKTHYMSFQAAGLLLLELSISQISQNLLVITHIHDLIAVV